MERQLQKESREGICFDGNDTLCLAQFMQRMQRMDEFAECRQKCVVHIQGSWTPIGKPANPFEPVDPIGFPLGGDIKGYIRRIMINCVSGERGRAGSQIDAGGSNATFEDIAATRVSFDFFGIPKTWEKLVEASDFALHDVRMTKYLNDDELRRYVDTRQYALAIAVAKHLHSRLAAMTLVKYLHCLDQDAATMEKLTDAVRSLETLCQANKKWSYAATCALLKYIKSNIGNKRRGNSVIYAIEALGYVTPPNERSRKRVCDSLSELLGDLVRSEYHEKDGWWYWHIVWASLVVFKRTMHPALKIEVIQKLDRTLGDRGTLAEIEPEEAQEVVQGLMCEVIRLHTQAVGQAPPRPPLIKIGPGAILHILHLSDIHLGTQRQAKDYLAKLVADLERGPELEMPVQPNYLVISGDIASESTEDDYEAAYILIDGLMQNYELGPESVVIVPGNHDVNWDLSEDAYKFYPARRVPAQPDPDDCVQAGVKGTLIRQYPNYNCRFDNFSLLYNKICGKGYPLEPEYQAELRKRTADNVVFLALNSCWNIDHHFPDRSGICGESLNNALAELHDPAYNTWLKIAVWHHPVTGREAMAPPFLALLRLYGFQISLHGHIHAAIQGFHYADPMLNIRIIGAGTFGASVPGVPLEYNLIKYDPNGHKMTVNTRKKDTQNSIWTPDYLWDDGSGHRKPYYDFPIQFP